MSVEVKVPDLGDGIDSADVLEVLVNVGDTIKKDDGIIELETDKATAVVPSTHSGKVLKILVAEGDSIPVGTALISLEPGETESAEPAAEKSSPAESKPSPEPAATDSSPADETPSNAAPADSSASQASNHVEPPVSQPPVTASQPAQQAESQPSTTATFGVNPSEIPAGPAMRRFAREVGVDLSRVTGSGEGGRITRNDILGVVRSGGKSKAPATSADGQQDQFGPVRIEKLTRMRRTIAAQMHASWSTVPRVTNFDDADVTDLEAIRQASKGDYAARGIKLTSMPFVIKSIAMALRDHPVINASLSEDGQNVIYKEYIHIGIAVDTERGLVVPALRNAESLSIPEIARQLGQMADKVRNNDFTKEDLQGGTFTISNLGAIGGTYSTPIVNVPETSIILVGRSRKMPVVKDDEIVARLMMPLSISYDHRLVDGAAAARFLNDVIAYLEAPSRLLLAP